ncbi:MAG: hypothetical protein F6J93_32315 [Oscillatoria sp. SIO1A7]|nr:hypothetical protein [Oscillatoria sp. SIO1A7]
MGLGSGQRSALSGQLKAQSSRAAIAPLGHWALGMVDRGDITPLQNIRYGYFA